MRVVWGTGLLGQAKDGPETEEYASIACDIERESWLTYYNSSYGSLILVRTIIGGVCFMNQY